MSFSGNPRNQRPRKRPQVTWEEFLKLSQEAIGPGKEVLSHIYQAILKTPEFTLADGTKCRVDALFEPTVSADGDLTCGFDVLLGDAGHLEFTIEQSGSGRALAPDAARNPPKRGRS
ncbi:MAG: hypothetical protein ACLQVF_28290 [Isosphaeraceae bacterium]